MGKAIKVLFQWRIQYSALPQGWAAARLIEKPSEIEKNGPDGMASQIRHWLLVSTYVIYERLSVMQRQARLPEFLVQISMSAPI